MELGELDGEDIEEEIWMNNFFLPPAENQKGEKLVYNLERLESLVLNQF